MTHVRRKTFQAVLGLGTLLGALGGLAIGLRVTQAGMQSDSSQADTARQVTVFAVRAEPGGKGADAKLASLKPQLERLLPRHAFKVLDVQSKRLNAGELLECDLGRDGFIARTSLIKPEDENGKVEIRCELWIGKVRQFSTQVKTPPNQLFFCERALKDGSKLLIGIGAR